MWSGVGTLSAILVSGSGAHAPNERVELSTFVMQTERAALLMLRLGSRPAAEFTRTAPTGR